MDSNLLGQLELGGKVVTGDALYCQRDLSLGVQEQGGDYFWALKDNQPGTRERVSLLFEQPPWGESFGEARQEGRHGDRRERLRLWESAALNGYLDWVGTGLLRGADQKAQGQGDRGAGLRHHQPAAGAGVCYPVVGDPARPLGNRKPAALGAGRGIRRGPEPSANRVSAATAGSTTELGNRPIAAERSQNISAALRHYGWKPWEALSLIGL